jgi:hypothetical protein
MVQISGSQPPVDEQNAAHAPSSSTIGRSAYANKVPEVPRLIASRPSATQPVPIAAIMLSPPPTATFTCSDRPSCAAVAGAMSNSASGSAMGGRHTPRLRSRSVARSSSFDHCRVRTSSQPVPEASPYSQKYCPVRTKLR